MSINKAEVTAQQLLNAEINRRTWGEIINVKSFGAVGNGLIDDTLSFQKAIDFLGTKGGTIIVPRGKYKITDTLDIDNSISIIGEGWSMRDGTTILSFYMDGKPLTNPAIKIHNIECVHLEGLYILNQGNELRDGIAIDGTGNGNNNEINSFVSCHRVISNNWKYCFKIAHTWFVSFRDCYASRGNYGWYAQGGTITTLLLDHCYAANQDTRAFYINGAYYTTFISCATDYAPIGYKLSNAENVVMVGCACESAINTAVDIDNSTVIIDGLTSVGNGTGTDANFATMLNVTSSRINVRGLSEISLPENNTKIASVALASNVIGEYVSTGKELLQVIYPKNGRMIYNGQSFTTGIPTATGWLTGDIGKVVYESNPIESGVSGSKYVVFGYVRKTSGNGNVLGTDWLPLRALTGN